MRSLRSLIVPLMLFVAFFSVAVSLQHRALEKVRQYPPFIETWQLRGRSGDVLKLLSLRYDLVAADFLWLRSIQSFGGRGMTNRDWRPLYNLFDTITELDPEFEEAYSFGNMVIGDEGGKLREALGLIDKGMFKLLRQYRLAFEGMYVAHWQLADQELARWYGRMASKRQNAPDWVPRMTAYIEVQSGAYYIGFDRFVASLVQALEAQDATLQAIAITKLKETIDKWNVSYLVNAAIEYKKKNGSYPDRIEKLAGMQALQNYEVGSMSRLLAASQAVLSLTGRPALAPDFAEAVVTPTGQQVAEAMQHFQAIGAKKELSEYQNELFKYALVKHNGIPEDPSGSGYVLNLTHIGYTERDAEPITTEKKRQAVLDDLLGRVRGVIAERTQELGRPPASLREVFYTDFNTTEPYGGKWSYDPKTGDFRSTSRPEL